MLAAPCRLLGRGSLADEPPRQDRCGASVSHARRRPAWTGPSAAGRRHVSNGMLRDHMTNRTTIARRAASIALSACLLLTACGGPRVVDETWSDGHPKRQGQVIGGLQE